MTSTFTQMKSTLSYLLQQKIAKDKWTLELLSSVLKTAEKNKKARIGGKYEDARNMGVKDNGKKQEMIRSIQRAEGNEACFGMKSNCSAADCCWREDCQPKKSC